MTLTAWDVAFAATDGTRLAGTMTAPGDGTWPTALIVNGSGPLDRDSAMPGQALGFADAMAAELAATGVASLRFDKRGVGQSGGNFLSTGLDQETNDVAAALAWLRTAPGVEPRRIALIGHSVGALISVRLAVTDSAVGAVVLLAGPAQAGDRVIEWQSRRIAASLPGPTWLLPKIALAGQRYSMSKLARSTGPTVRLLIRRQPARYLREFMAYDPEADFRRIRCPVLAITGGKDLQVDPADVERIGSLVAGPFNGETPANLTHLLRLEKGSGGILNYRSQLKRPVDHQLLARVSGWVAEKLEDQLAGRPTPRHSSSRRPSGNRRPPTEPAQSATRTRQEPGISASEPRQPLRCGLRAARGIRSAPPGSDS